jgi:hypothetical protein
MKFPINGKMFQTTNQHSTNMDLFHESWILGLTENKYTTYSQWGNDDNP